MTFLVSIFFSLSSFLPYPSDPVATQLRAAWTEFKAVSVFQNQNEGSILSFCFTDEIWLDSRWIFFSWKKK